MLLFLNLFRNYNISFIGIAQCLFIFSHQSWRRDCVNALWRSFILLYLLFRYHLYVYFYYCIFKSSYSSPYFGGKSRKRGRISHPPAVLSQVCCMSVACCKFSKSLSLKVNTSAIHRPGVSFEYSA